ncbi:DUF3419 family protein [Halobacteriovorax sp. XZX-3]|uniref:DUF3419 family protein n=1 Tax=unclassified Halobacteriovorax TaxID=2639665 RepID=UPI00370FC389
MAKYFTDKLNYSLANEDIAMESKVCEKLSPKKIGSICGAGPRGLYLITNTDSKLDLFDVSGLQIEWARAYEKAILALEEVDYLRAYHDDSAILKTVGANVGLNDYFEANEIAALAGSWEKTFITFSKLCRKILGHRIIEALRNCKTIQEQLNIMDTVSFKVKWTVVLSIVGNKALMNSLLYRGDFIRKNIPESYVKFYRNRFARLFKNNLIKDNFFLSLCFFGEVTLTNTPLRCRNYSKLKECIETTQVNYHIGDVVAELESGKYQFDYFSYSDVPSYFDDKLGKDFIKKARPSIAIGGVICVRYYLRVHTPELEGFEDITAEFKDLIKKEKVGVYDIRFYKRVS